LSGQERLKRLAAERAVEFVEDGMVLGLGTGSTARHVVEILAERLRDGTLRDITGVPTSKATERHAQEVGLPLITLEYEPRLDLTIDGADEIDPDLNLIKGLGGALLWEKIVATASDRLVIVADASKRVERLGEKAPLPVEVVPFGWTTHLAFLDLLGAQATLRQDEKGNPIVTDGGHYLLDCHFEDGILEPDRLERELRSRVGVVETGLFLRMADTAVIAAEDGVDVLISEAS
jgi:ribose 5-phosphate isomerase A